MFHDVPDRRLWLLLIHLILKWVNFESLIDFFDFTQNLKVLKWIKIIIFETLSFNHKTDLIPRILCVVFIYSDQCILIRPVI